MISAVMTEGGYHHQLDQALRANGYLRVLFSVTLMGYAGFGPGLLIRFPFFLEGVRLGPVAWFHGFRPAIFALLFISLVGVLAALARRGRFLFEELLRESYGEGPASPERARHVRNLAPSPFPFVLSGNQFVDSVIFLVAVVAYCFWALLLVEAVPTGMGTHQAAGVVLGTYGLAGGLIIVVAVWTGLLRRAQRYEAGRNQPPPA